MLPRVPIVVLLLCAAALRAQIGDSGNAATKRSDPGQAVFNSICARCHGLDGRGGEHGPNIATTQEARRRSDADLEAIIAHGKPAAGMPGFASTFRPEQIRAVARWVRVLQGRVAPAQSRGNAANGRELFYGKAGCSVCHSVSGKDGVVAEDLSSWANGRSGEELRAMILEPDHEIERAHRTVTVVTADGHTYSGLVRNEDNFSLQLQSMDGTFHFLPKSAVTSIGHSVVYGSGLTSTEIDDIVAFVVSGEAKRK